MQAGDFFNERYIIEKVLGRGGMGTVYLARNINTDTYWAIKEINRRTEAKADMQINLTAEPDLLKRLEHPALPRLFDIVEQDGKLYMISDYIDGISLDKKIAAEGKIAEEIVVDWAIQLCRALDYLHCIKPNPIIYRDIKPSNIMLTGTGRVKLIDFGTAREYKPQSSADTVYIGTRGYAAPEQFGTGQTSAVSDIYSLGVTLHHLITGKSPVEPPYKIKPIREYDQRLSPELEVIISKCTCESMEERYQNVSQLLDDLLTLYEKNDTGRYNNNMQKGASTGNNAEISVRADNDQERKYAHNVHSFRRMVITVWDNAEFGCELAYTAAKYTKSDVLLADLDLLAPKADLILNVGKYSSRQSELAMFGYSGLDIIMDAAGKGMLTSALLRQASVVRNDMKNLHIVTGNYRLENYEYYSVDCVTQLIDKCYRNFDVTVILVNRSIYDAFTLAALLGSDMNIAAISGDVGQLREFNTYIAFLHKKQRLSQENTKFVIFEHDRSSDMNAAEIRQATQDNLLGMISYSRRRVVHRNLKGAYASHMDKDILSEYWHIHEKLGLIPAANRLQKFKQLCGRIVGGAYMTKL